MRKFNLVLIVLFLSITLSACNLIPTTQNNNQSFTQAPTNPTPTITTNSSVSTNKISIENSTLTPSSITVKKGTTVIWQNNDYNLHQLISSSFDSSTLSKGDKFNYVFDTVGTFDYSCKLHPSMKGIITVTN